MSELDRYHSKKKLSDNLVNRREEREVEEKD